MVLKNWDNLLKTEVKKERLAIFNRIRNFRFETSKFKLYVIYLLFRNIIYIFFTIILILSTANEST